MSGGLLSLKWNHHKSTFLHILRDIRQKDQFSDVILACDGKFYYAHKLVLATCSEYFESMFQQTQCKQPVIVLKDISRVELEALLSYMYDGEVNVLQEHLSMLIKAAECLKIKGLAVADEDPAKASLTSTKKKLSDSNSRDQSCKDSNSERIARNKRSHNLSDSSKESDQQSKRRKNESVSENEDVMNENNIDGNDLNHIAYQNTEDVVKQEPLETPDIDEKLNISQSYANANCVEADNKNSSDLRKNRRTISMDNDSNENRSSTNSIADFLDDKFRNAGERSSSPNCEIPSLWLNNENDESLSQASTSQYMTDDTGQHLGTNNKSDTMASSLDLNISSSALLTSLATTLKRNCLQSLNILPDASELELLDDKEAPHYLWGRSKDEPLPSHLSATELNAKGERVYYCIFCPYNSNRSDTLRVHIRTHTGEKPYTCRLCSYRCNQKSQLTRHIASKHSV